MVSLNYECRRFCAQFTKLRHECDDDDDDAKEAIMKEIARIRETIVFGRFSDSVSMRKHLEDMISRGNETGIIAGIATLENMRAQHMLHCLGKCELLRSEVNYVDWMVESMPLQHFVDVQTFLHEMVNHPMYHPLQSYIDEYNHTEALEAGRCQREADVVSEHGEDGSADNGSLPDRTNDDDEDSADDVDVYAVEKVHDLTGDVDVYDLEDIHVDGTSEDGDVVEQDACSLFGGDTDTPTDTPSASKKRLVADVSTSSSSLNEHGAQSSSCFSSPKRRIMPVCMLEEGASSVAGRGVFARVDFEIGDVLCDYIGVVVSSEVGQAAADDGNQCVMQCGFQHCILGVGIGSKINDNRNVDMLNCYCQETMVRGPNYCYELKLKVIAAKRIGAGEELFFSYGTRFWKDRLSSFLDNGNFIFCGADDD